VKKSFKKRVNLWGVKKMIARCGNERGKSQEKKKMGEAPKWDQKKGFGCVTGLKAQDEGGKKNRTARKA